MKKSQKKALAVGASAAALAAAAAGAYFLTGTRGAKNRKKVSAWAAKAQQEVVSELKSLQKFSKPAYLAAVDAVTRRYKTMKNVDPAELAAMARELKGQWDAISKRVNGTAKVTKVVKRTATSKKRPATSKARSKK